MGNRERTITLTVLCGALLLPVTGSLAATATATATTGGAVTASGDTRKKVSRIRFIPGSGETPAERRARLKLECKGRPNAGLCRGMTD